MTKRFKITLAIIFILSLIIGAHYAHAGPVYNTTTTICSTCGSTTTTTTDGKTTTVTTIVNKTALPGSQTILNLPKPGDATTIVNNQIVTTTTSITDGATTGNLLTGTSFCTAGVWSGSQITGGGSDLGCNYLTGKGGNNSASTSFTLTDKGVSVLEQSYGLTQSSSISASMYFPNSMSMTITQGVKNLDTNETITQNRTISGIGNYWSGGFYTVAPDNIIISPNVNGLDGTSNLKLGYQSTLSLNFSSPLTNNPSYPYSGVDVTNPNLTVNYNNVTQTQNIAIVPVSIIHYCWQNVPSTCPGDPLTSMAPPTSKPTAVSNTGQFTTLSPTTVTQIMTMQTSTNPIANNQTTAMALTGDPTASIGVQPDTKNIISGGTNTTAMTSSTDTNSTSTNGGTNANTPSTTSTTTTGSSTTQTNQTAQNTPTQSGATQNSKTEGSQTQTTNEKNVSDSKTTNASTGITSTGDAKADAKSASIDAKIKSELAKVDRTLMTVSERTRAIQDIKLDGMKASAADLSSYENKRLQDGKTMVGIPNPDFYKQINISQQQIYKDATLSAYIIKDPIAVKQRLLKEIEDEQNSIILEIEMLKKGIKKG